MLNSLMIVRTLLIFFLANLSLLSQTKTNLEIFKVLVDSSISEALINSTESPENIYLNIKLGTSYNIFEDQIYQLVQARNKKIVAVNNPSENLELSYSIENAVVEYGEIVRDGFLGDHFVSRLVSLSGSYRFNLKEDETKMENFYYESIDSVKFNDIQKIENSSYPFTKGEIPSEPFFSNLVEPLVAITTAAVVIALFFTVRSK